MNIIVMINPKLVQILARNNSNSMSPPNYWDWTWNDFCEWIIIDGDFFIFWRWMTFIRINSDHSFHFHICFVFCFSSTNSNPPHTYYLESEQKCGLNLAQADSNLHNIQFGRQQRKIFSKWICQCFLLRF
jgi:hypothetical protein